jgi:hypothetical protein
VTDTADIWKICPVPAPTITQPELAVVPGLKMWMLSATIPRDALSYQFR